MKSNEVNDGHSAVLSTAGVGFTVGQSVRLRVNAWNPPSEDGPGGLYGKRGDKLIVKEIGPASYHHPIAVHHEDVTDGSAFGVRADEIEPWREVTPNAKQMETIQ